MGRGRSAKVRNDSPPGILGILKSPDLWKGVYFFAMFQIALYSIGAGATADNALFWTIGGIALGLFTIVHALLTISKRLDRSTYYDIPNKWVVLLTVIGLYLFVFTVSFILLFIGIEPSVQPNQETVNLIMEAQKVPMMFITVLVAPITEELVFRELLPSAGGNTRLSFILSSILFALLHAPAGITGWLIYGGISAAFLYLRLKGNNVMQAVHGHVFYNLLSTLLSLI